MKGHGSKFRQKKEEAIAALLTNRNLEEAAKATGIATNTLLRWMKEAEFKTAYLDAVGLRLASRSRVFSRPPARPLPNW
jgi:transposase-like protein